MLLMLLLPEYCVLLTKTLPNPRFFFVVLVLPLLLQAGKTSNLFKTELLVDEEGEDCKENYKDPNSREEPNCFRSNWE